MNPRKERLLYLGIALTFLCVMFALGAKAEDVIYPEKEWVKGAVVVGVKNDGGCVYKPFVKTGDTNNNPDDDQPQILGYEPGNVMISKDGEVIWERVYEAQFIPLNKRKTVNGRVCACPAYRM